VNSLNLPFTSLLHHTLKEIEDSGLVDAVIVESRLPNVFSAGLDLHELHGVSRDHLDRFWSSVQDLWLQLYSSRLVTLSYINGHCLAAGTIIAAACDYRIACEGDYQIGVTAAKVGLVAPPWFLKLLSHLMGERRAEHILQIGRTFSPEEAVQVGLVDNICSSGNGADACLQALNPFLSVSQESRQRMKQYFRAELIDSFNVKRFEDKEDFLDFVLKESVQEQLGVYIQQLNKK
jgi:3,2-trans-enoyl-CoA isomerase